MSALGQEQTSRLLEGMSALLPKADMVASKGYVCLMPVHWAGPIIPRASPSWIGASPPSNSVRRSRR
jgi:hypothetical protein